MNTQQAATIDGQGEVISRLEKGLMANKRDCEPEERETGKINHHLKF